MPKSVYRYELDKDRALIWKLPFTNLVSQICVPQSNVDMMAVALIFGFTRCFLYRSPRRIGKSPEEVRSDYTQV